jgi:hypothetical protein
MRDESKKVRAALKEHNLSAAFYQINSINSMAMELEKMLIIATKYLCESGRLQKELEELKTNKESKQ